MWSFFVVLVFSTNCLCYQQWRTVYQKITQEAEFSGFNSMIKNNGVARLNLVYVPLTVFVPENDAIDNYDGDFPNSLVLYHMGMEVRTLNMLNRNNSMETSNTDSLPVWITVTEDGYYINNAKIVEEKSNYVSATKGDPDKKQVLHVIDRVLDPLIYTSSFSKPTAYTFLSHYYKWKIGSYKAMNFLHKVELHNKESLYQNEGGHTFFVPIDHKTDDYKWENIDSYVIDGHVVPNMVLFTRPTSKNFIFETAASGDFIYIAISLHVIGGKDYVKSYTVLGNSNHKKGEVLTEIVRANIPVANGVVHLIKQPLAVFDRDLKPFPYLSVYYKVSADPELSQTFKIARRTKINKLIQDESPLYTFFVPRDRAWKKYLNFSNEELEKILGRHVVTSDSRLSMTKLIMMARNNGEATLNTVEGTVKLRIDHTNDGYFIIWNKKRIKVLRPDYECSNGIVHIMDDVFAEVKSSSGPANYVAKEDDRGFWRLLKDIVM